MELKIKYSIILYLLEEKTILNFRLTWKLVAFTDRRDIDRYKGVIIVEAVGYDCWGRVKWMDKHIFQQRFKTLAIVVGWLVGCGVGERNSFFFMSGERYSDWLFGSCYTVTVTDRLIRILCHVDTNNIWREEEEQTQYLIHLYLNILNYLISDYYIWFVFLFKFLHVAFFSFSFFAKSKSHPQCFLTLLRLF